MPLSAGRHSLESVASTLRPATLHYLGQFQPLMTRPLQQSSHSGKHLVDPSTYRKLASQSAHWLVWKYAGIGFLLGLILTGAAWVFEIINQTTDSGFPSLIHVHKTNPLLYLIDTGPFLGALFFYMIGRAQYRLLCANDELEDRVRDRSFEVTLEKARLNAILDTAADGIIAFDYKGRIISFNNAAQQIFGYKAKEVMGRDLAVLIPALQSDSDSNSANMIWTDEDEHAANSRSRNVTGLRKDGTEVPLEADLSKFNFGDEESFTAIVRDVSERRRAERLEKSLTEVTQAVNQSQDLSSLYQAIYDSLSNVMYINNLYIALYRHEEEYFEIVYKVGENSDQAPDTIPGRRTLAARVFEREDALLVSQNDYELMVSTGAIDALHKPFKSWLGIPLRNQGQNIGVMAVQSFEEGLEYSEKDLWILNFLSGQIANAIDRERARESLRVSEKRYRRMVEEAGDIVFTTDARGRLTYINPPAMKLTGYQEQELLGKQVIDLVAPDHRNRVRAFYLTQLREGKRDTVLEFPILTKDEEKIWIEQNATLLSDGDEPTGFQSIVHDVTERRNAEAALREREERFRSLSASSPTGIFQLDSSGQCIYANNRFLQITGRTLADCLGGGWLKSIHPEERETFRTEWIFARAENTFPMREVRLQLPNEEERWVNVRWSATYSDDEHISGYVGTFEDISARKRIEKINRVQYEISEAVQNSPSLQEFFSSLHSSLSSVIDTTNFYVALYDESTGIISFPYTREEGQVKPLDDRKIGKGLTGYVIRKGETVLLDDQKMRKLYERGECELIGRPARSWLGVPLISDVKVIGCVIIQSYTDAELYTQEDVQTMSFVSSQIAAAIKKKQGEEARALANQQLAEAHQRIKEELALAARIQQSRLPKQAPPVESVEFSWIFNSCDEVAGDMFNFVMLDENHIAIYIFDVSGHGVAAALLSMSLSRALSATTDGSGVLLRKTRQGVEIATPAEVAAAMNERFPMNMDTNQYFTMIYGVLDLQTNEFRFVRGGHPSPIIVTRHGAKELDAVCGPAIGIIPNAQFREHSVTLDPGDKLVLFTDGLDESTNKSGEEFGIERIVTTLGSSNGTSISEHIRDLSDAVYEFTRGVPQSDDITIVGLHLRRKKITENRAEDIFGVQTYVT